MTHLCDNPSCSLHCVLHLVKDPVTLTDHWRFKDGFGCLVPKMEAGRFDPASSSHYCRVCTAARSLPAFVPPTEVNIEP